MARPFRVRVAIGLMWLLSGNAAWARAIGYRWTIDVGMRANTSPVVFRGRVVEVKPIGRSDAWGLDALARFEPDRWYRATRPQNVWVHFVWDAFAMLNHNCENLTPGSDWLIFATGRVGPFELVDDCQAALPVSQQLGSVIRSPDYTSQMQSDFAADRNDSSFVNRILSLWCLQMPSSRTTLLRWIDGSGGVEKTWARHALARSLSARGSIPEPAKDMTGIGNCEFDGHLGLDARRLANSVRKSSSELALGCAVRALAAMKAREGLKAIAARLNDARSGVRWDALAACRR